MAASLDDQVGQVGRQHLWGPLGSRCLDGVGMQRFTERKARERLKGADAGLSKTRKPSRSPGTQVALRAQRGA